MGKMQLVYGSYHHIYKHSLHSSECYTLIQCVSLSGLLAKIIRVTD